jgi:hypothetical protein
MKFIRYRIGFIPYGMKFIRYGIGFIRYVVLFTFALFPAYFGMAGVSFERSNAKAQGRICRR